MRTVCEELKDFEILDATPTPTSDVAEGLFEVAPELAEAAANALESQNGISLDESIVNQEEEPLVQEIPIPTYECELDEYGYFLGTFPAPKPIVCSLQLKLAADEEYERKVSSRNRLRIGFQGKSMSAILDTGSDVSTVSWPFLQRYGYVMEDLYRSNAEVIKSVGGDIQILGTVNLVFTLDKFTFKQVFHVLNTNLYRILIGKDFLDEHRLVTRMR